MNTPAGACVLAVCGWKNSGKTTLLERVIPVLTRRGLRVAALKHDAHGLDVDRPGKDSDRLYRAGATVSAQGPDEVFVRRHRSDVDELLDLVALLARDHDLVLVEGHKGTPLPKVWLDRADGEDVSASSGELPAETTNVLARLAWDADRQTQLLDFLDRWLTQRWRERTVYGAILIGGQSRRMGRPKHLIETGRVTWFERTQRVLSRHVSRVIVLGAGDLPTGDRESNAAEDNASVNSPDTLRLPDAPDANGPVAGVLAAVRWAPEAAWLVCACDLPDLSDAALAWLLEQRRPGRWAVLPRSVGGRVEPLLAVYEPQSQVLLEALRHYDIDAPRRLTQFAQVFSPEIPDELGGSWRDRDTPGELEGPNAQA